jgi:hypothetical protein
MILAVEVYVVDLEEMKREIEALAGAKGFYNSRGATTDAKTS